MRYPKREPYFAQKAIRLLVKTAAAQHIGQAATLLVMTVATTEDAARYRRPVSFFNGQLMMLLGIQKWESLDRARKVAIESGWLCYEAPPKGKRKPGLYWVTIPPDVAGLDDTPVDEAYPQPYPQVSPPNGYGEGDSSGYSRGYGEGELSELTLSLEDSCPELSQATDAGPPDPSEFVFPTKGKGAKTWTLPKAKLIEYAEAFPGVDVDQELRRARQWCRDNPTKRKTATGMLGFLTRWLGKEQNSRANGNGHATHDFDPAPIIRATTPPPEGYEA